jgi:hypothetical protein
MLDVSGNYGYSQAINREFFEMSTITAKRTVGPWEYDAESGQIIAPKCGYQWQRGPAVIATVESLDYGESAGNGKSMAAAPKLIEALLAATAQLSAEGFDCEPYRGALSAAGVDFFEWRAGTK